MQKPFLLFVTGMKKPPTWKVVFEVAYFEYQITHCLCFLSLNLIEIQAKNNEFVKCSRKMGE